MNGEREGIVRSRARVEHGAEVRAEQLSRRRGLHRSKLGRSKQRPYRHNARDAILKSTALEFEDDSDLGAEIVLGAVADYGGIAEAGANPININGAEGDVFAEGKVETAADGEVEGIVVRDSAKVDTFALDGALVVEVRVKIVVHPPEHNLRKRQDALKFEAQDGASGVGVHVAVNR